MSAMGGIPGREAHHHGRPQTSRRPTGIMKFLALVLVGSISIGCSTPTQIPVDTTTSPTTPGTEPDRPPGGEAPIVDWTDPNSAVTFDDGWGIAACEGDAPLLCAEKGGASVGTIEAAAYPMASFEGLDPAAGAEENLVAFADGFLKALGDDRAAGCGPDYFFEPLEIRDFVVAASPGVAFGFEGVMPDGSPSELNLQYATIIEDKVISITAIAYDEGGCPGRDELSGFRTVDLVEFRPHLESVLHESPLPPLGE